VTEREALSPGRLLGNYFFSVVSVVLVPSLRWVVVLALTDR